MKATIDEAGRLVIPKILRDHPTASAGAPHAGNHRPPARGLVPESRFLGARAAASLMARLADAGIAGGLVYDALVGATAREHGLTPATRDRRALETHRVLGVAVEFIG